MYHRPIGCLADNDNDKDNDNDNEHDNDNGKCITWVLAGWLAASVWTSSTLIPGLSPRSLSLKPRSLSSSGKSCNAHSSPS